MWSFVGEKPTWGRIDDGGKWRRMGVVWVEAYRWWEEKTTENRELWGTMQARGREERGGTCGRRWHLGRSSMSKYSFSQESCMPKCCSKMHMKMRLSGTGARKRNGLRRPVHKGEMNTGVPRRIWEIWLEDRRTHSVSVDFGSSLLIF